MPHSPIAHLYQTETQHGSAWIIQTNADHCQGTARLSATFASAFGMENWGLLLGLLHDRGKDSHGFQAYIRRNSGLDPDAKSTDPHFHSLAGAIIIHTLPQDNFLWLSNAIAGHHRGLYDSDELELLLSSPLSPEISREIPYITLPNPPFKLLPSEAHHIGRMLFSCLIDADRLDTERFMSPDTFTRRGQYDSMTELKHRLDKHMHNLRAKSAGPIASFRNEIQNKCHEGAELNPGFFNLTVPTGGGKTLASMIWAIEHALHHGMERIIVAIPFTSIIVQTASIFKKIFGSHNVIEHHSLTDPDESDERTRLATENWEAPIIVTTNVQLFESMYSNRPSRCRRLHSLARSVLILDEVQMLPFSLLQPIVDALKSYVKLFKMSCLFTTATQPVLHGEHHGNSNALFRGIPVTSIRPLTDTSMKLEEKLRRVRISILEDTYDYASLATELARQRRVLCVVNTRRHALRLYEELIRTATDKTIIHLSRNMCADHILSAIDRIKTALEDPEKELIVVSTQLIEAGVDIDFPVVYRQLAGLDSILQSAGRCNREGRLSEGETCVFSFEGEKDYGMTAAAADTMRDMISLHPDADWFSPEVISEYYTRLYSRIPTFDKAETAASLGDFRNIQYETASSRFRLIDDIGTSIVINYGEAPDLIERLGYAGLSRGLMREIGRYSVSVPERVFRNLMASGLIDEPAKGVYYIPYKEQYDPNVGLKTQNEFSEMNLVL